MVTHCQEVIPFFTITLNYLVNRIVAIRTGAMCLEVAFVKTARKRKVKIIHFLKVPSR